MAQREFGTGRIRKPDARDKLHPMKAPLIKTKDLVAYDTGKVLDQKMTPMCGGFAWRALLSAPPFNMKGGPSPEEIFRGARRFDGLPDTGYPGTTARGAAEYLQKLGIIGEYVWADQIEPALNWMRAGRGPILFGSNILEGMYEADKENIVHATGPVRDSHLYLLTAIDDPAGLLEITNSWGEGWGKKGRAWLPIADARKLLKAGGEMLGAKRPNEKWDGPKAGDVDVEPDDD